MSSLRGKSNTALALVTVGSSVSMGGFSHGPAQTPNYAVTSQAARPQYITGQMSVTSGGNNYVRFIAYNQSGAALAGGNYIQIGIYASPTTFTYSFTDILQPYATNYYHCYSDCAPNGDYSYMKQADTFNYFTFAFSSWAG